MLPVDSIINLHKPVGITSAKALYRVRRLTGIRKSGHAGTLDPAAEGVLIICQGKATKLVESMMDLHKIYRATARLDLTSESFDSDGPTFPVPVQRIPDLGDVQAALASFEGVIQQVPPAISAVKIKGVPAYKLARSGKEPRLRAREARIYWIGLHALEWPMIDFELACGRGTYVRSIIRDLGHRLGTGGCLTSLIRTAVGPFEIRSAVSLDTLACDGPDGYIVPLSEARAQIASSAQRIPPRPRFAIEDDPPGR